MKNWTYILLLIIVLCIKRCFHLQTWIINNAFLHATEKINHQSQHKILSSARYLSSLIPPLTILRAVEMHQIDGNITITESYFPDPWLFGTLFPMPKPVRQSPKCSDYSPEHKQDLSFAQAMMKIFVSKLVTWVVSL